MSTDGETPPTAPPPSDLIVIKNFLSRDFKASIMFGARIFAAVNGLLFAFSTFFNPSLAFSSYQRVMFAFGLASVIRLSQRLGPVQFTKEYMISVVLEDSAHYMLYSCNFYAHKPTTIIAFIPTLYCALQASAFATTMLGECSNSTWNMLKVQLGKMKEKQQQLLRVVATAEIFILPLVGVQLFTGQCGSILTPLVYYQFLVLRYMSRRNPYVKNAFSEMKVVVNQMIYSQSCPGFVRSIVSKAMGLIERMSPVSYQPAS